jgi:hypothetical protein
MRTLFASDLNKHLKRHVEDDRTLYTYCSVFSWNLRTFIFKAAIVILHCFNKESLIFRDAE